MSTANASESAASFAVTGIRGAISSMARGSRRRARTGAKPKPARSVVEPHVLEAPAVILAVRHDRQVLHARPPAGSRADIVDDRPRDILLQLLVDVPDQLLALLRIGLCRLLGEQLLQVLVAIVGEVAFRAAGIVLEEILVGIVDRVAGVVE